MFKPATVARTFLLCSCLDPALDLPVVPDVEDDSKLDPEELERIVKLREQYATELRVARETERWPVKEGEKATFFEFRQIHGTALSWWLGEIERKGYKRDEQFELMFRLALVSVKNCPGLGHLKAERVGDERLITRESLEELYNIGRDIGQPTLGRMIILELGGVVATRAVSGVPPL